MNSWDALNQHKRDADFRLRDLLDDPARCRRLTMNVENVLFDFSKHLVTDDTLGLLISLADDKELSSARDDLFNGAKINTSEDRPALHTALRMPRGGDVEIDGENIVSSVHFTLDRMKSFSTRVIDGYYKGYSGKRFTDAVAIGIGGSHLGPRLVTEALTDYNMGLRIHYLSNVDGACIESVLGKINPETTLFIIASKTFTTEETILNARVVRDWFLSKAGTSAVPRHFVALSTNKAAARTFGISDELVFPFWDWVGGRYSLWSAIGLPVMLAVGPDHFDHLLAGAHAMDRHFISAPLEKNVPVLMGLLGIWYRNFWHYPAHLVLPYDFRLRSLPRYIQQVDMESNGKSVDRLGHTVDMQTAPFVFGEAGTDNQHSFMQLVHQGTTPVPSDFIFCAKPHHTYTASHISLVSNCLAQSRALAIGRTELEAGRDQENKFPGNRPSTTIMLPEMSPFNLGLLLAAYEHKVFVQGVIWNINSFDQPGVELGKEISRYLTPVMTGESRTTGLDASTQELVENFQRLYFSREEALQPAAEGRSAQLHRAR